MSKRPKNTNTTAASTATELAAKPAPAPVKHKTPQEQEAAHHHAVVTNAIALQHSLRAAKDRSGLEMSLLYEVSHFLLLNKGANHES